MFSALRSLLGEGYVCPWPYRVQQREPDERCFLAFPLWCALSTVLLTDTLYRHASPRVSSRRDIRHQTQRTRSCVCSLLAHGIGDILLQAHGIVCADLMIGSQLMEQVEFVVIDSPDSKCPLVGFDVCCTVQLALKPVDDADPKLEAGGTIFHLNEEGVYFPTLSILLGHDLRMKTKQMRVLENS